MSLFTSKKLLAAAAALSFAAMSAAAPVTWDYAFDTPDVDGFASIGAALQQASVNGTVSGRFSFDSDDMFDIHPNNPYYFVDASQLTHVGQLTDWFGLSRGIYVWKDDLRIAKWFYPELLSDPSQSLDIEFDRGAVTVQTGSFGDRVEFALANLRLERVEANEVPEPASMALVATGLAAWAALARRRKPAARR